MEREDLLQEARLAFLHHIRRIPDESAIPLCQFDIFGVLCAYCRAMALVRIPKYCFKEEIRKVRRADYTDALLEPDRTSSVGMELSVEIRDFENTLSETERRVFRMKREGYSNREIIPRAGVAGEPQMSRLLKSVRSKARAYFGQ